MRDFKISKHLLRIPNWYIFSFNEERLNKLLDFCIKEPEKDAGKIVGHK